MEFLADELCKETIILNVMTVRGDYPASFRVLAGIEILLVKVSSISM